MLVFASFSRFVESQGGRKGVSFKGWSVGRSVDISFKFIRLVLSSQPNNNRYFGSNTLPSRTQICRWKRSRLLFTSYAKLHSYLEFWTHCKYFIIYLRLLYAWFLYNWSWHGLYFAMKPLCGLEPLLSLAINNSRIGLLDRNPSSRRKFRTSLYGIGNFQRRVGTAAAVANCRDSGTIVK